MQNLLETLQFLWSGSRPQDLLDVLLVWLIVYRVLVLIKSSGAVQMLSGLGVLAMAYIGSNWLELHTFNWLLEKFFSHLFLIVVILFQGEIRRALAHIGSNPFLTGQSRVRESELIEELAQGVVQLAQKGYGALVVIENEIGLDYFTEVGTELGAEVSAELLNSIFHPASPLHDGAVVIRQGKIFAAGCFLPLSKNPALDKNLGTRHRAAIGLTEETDALVFVVSEENRSVGVVSGGQLLADQDHASVRQALFEVFGVAMRDRN